MGLADRREPRIIGRVARSRTAASLHQQHANVRRERQPDGGTDLSPPTVAHDAGQTCHRHEHPGRGHVDELAPGWECGRRVSSRARHVDDVRDEERQARQPAAIAGAPHGDGPNHQKGDHHCVREHPAAHVHQAEPHVSDAAARDLRVVGVGRERAICHPTVNRDRHERQPAGDRRRGDPSPALTPPGERQHVDTRDERALGPHRDEERRDDRLPLRWTDQRKRDEAGERHGLHARRGVEREWQVQREEDASQHGRTIVAAPEEHGHHGQRRRSPEHLGRYPNIYAEPRGAAEQQRPQQR